MLKLINDKTRPLMIWGDGVGSHIESNNLLLCNLLAEQIRSLEAIRETGFDIELNAARFIVSVSYANEENSRKRKRNDDFIFNESTMVLTVGIEDEDGYKRVLNAAAEDLKEFAPRSKLRLVA